MPWNYLNLKYYLNAYWDCSYFPDKSCYVPLFWFFFSFFKVVIHFVAGWLVHGLNLFSKDLEKMEMNGKKNNFSKIKAAKKNVQALLYFIYVTFKNESHKCRCKHLAMLGLAKHTWLAVTNLIQMPLTLNMICYYSGKSVCSFKTLQDVFSTLWLWRSNSKVSKFHVKCETALLKISHGLLLFFTLVYYIFMRKKYCEHNI